ncbi:MAG: bifunctional GNAT family N-acetyltransferase/carbon-nitrogen hydrolase family protein [Bacteroidota bacterium]|nr:bifunctional GNAT family N-acetyltransferase/carbon-nitrogen hydrolase family protein [Bacteroidota bacterium]MDP3145667.1 bifunctional GNAT family N-acetyltransferase/carbon-nitrogen hydrolase family protein [Bacteroidota bacterium]MDP3558659.1 bifunctional GNAT family N-acetyltransferase/carbon-nitrogen hydrolase family protein [Bacteroidota bacterium]
MKTKTNSIENKIKLRAINIKDYDAITALQLKCFPGMKPWNKEQFTNIITTFKQGQSCILLENKIIASSCSLIINFSNYSESSSWGELTANGNISNHDATGDTLYGMEIMVDPDYQGMKLSRRLYDARKNLAKHFNVKRILVGGRLPNYCKYSKKMGIDSYVEKVIDKRIYDPVLTSQLANGFSLINILPDYLPNDKESCGYATLLEWKNFGYKQNLATNHIHYSPYVRVSAVQYQMRSIKSFADFARQCEYFVDASSDYKSDFVVFPEMFTMQLLSFLENKRPSDAIRELSNFTQQYIDLFTSLAIKYNINIIGGSHFSVEDGVLYNISFLFRRDGTHDKQYKIHITPYESKWWGVKGGDKVQIFDTDKGKVAILICYDIEFPELSRIAVSKGAKILFVPFNTDDKRAYLRVRYCAQARAVENQVYVVLTGCVGNLPQIENLDIHFSQSAILTPSDVEFSREAIAAEAVANTETLIYQDLDLDLLQRNREMGNAQTWNDRKNGFYTLTYTENGKTIIV